MYKIITFIVALLMVAPVVAKPLDKPAGIRVKNKITFVTNARPLSLTHEAIVKGVEALNSYVKEPIIAFHPFPVPAYQHTQPLLSTITVASLHVLDDILGLFTPNILGMAALFPDPLNGNDGLVAKVVMREHYETENQRFYVLLHELMHAVGIPHVSDPEDLMYPAYIEGNKVGIQTLLQLYIRYKLAPKYEKIVTEHLDKLDPTTERKPPAFDRPPMKDPDGAFPNAVEHVCTHGVTNDKT